MSRARLLQLRTSRWRYLGLLALLGVYVAQAVAASPAHSVTFDEQYHLTLGYVYLAQRDLRFHQNQSPPLSEALLAAPLLGRSDIQLPIEHPAYQLWGDIYLFSDTFFWHSGNDPDSLVHAGRVMAALLGVLLGLLLFVWGRQLFGEAAGWIALFLFVFDPNFIANAIPTLDLPLAFAVTLAMFALWHYLKRPAMLTLVLAGLALGLALATKFLSVMLLPAMALALLLYPAADTSRTSATPHASVPSLPVGRTKHQALRLTHYSLLAKRLLAFALMLLIAWLVLWATYLFQFGPINGAGLPVPAPQYVESFIGMFLKSSEGRANYLLGEVSTTGWWYYFVVAFFLKTPLPTIIAIVFALVRWPWRREWRASSILYLPAFFFFVGASLSQLQLGYRYLLPVLPLLFLMAGRAAQDASLRYQIWPRMIVAILAVWLVVSAVITFPNHLSYFNELAGGPNTGHRYLTDSNVDWGQDLPALRNWIDLTQPDRLHLAFFGSAYPDRYGVDAIGIPGYPNSAFGREADAFTAYSLEPGQYAISATSLRIGLVSRLFDIYRRFAAMTPIAQPAPSILIYDVPYPAQAEVDRAVIAGPLAAEVSADDLGYRADHPLRAKYCEPGSCFILTPHPARYITTSDAPDWVKEAAVAVPSPASRYRVYQLDATSSMDEKLQQLQTAGAAISLTYPITFENGLAFAGYEIQPSGGSEPPGGLTVNTYWRVTDRLEPPVAVFVHLLDQDGQIAAQDDRFGAAARMLEPGDLIVQRHPIQSERPLQPGAYQIAIGLYHPDTLERFKTRNGEDRLLVGMVEIEP